MQRKKRDKRRKIVGPGTPRTDFDSETKPKQEAAPENPATEPIATPEPVLVHQNAQVEPGYVEKARQDGTITEAELVEVSVPELPKEWPNFDAWRAGQGILPTHPLAGENQENVVQRDPVTGRILPGASLNPAGRPPGTENFKTIFEKALKHVAQVNGKDPEALYIEIISKGIQQARKGDFRFFKDLMDRVHGKAKESIYLTSDGQPIAAGNQITFVNFRAPNDSDRQ